jgi:hypothetical protein
MGTSIEPKRIWWARPRKLCVMERPGGGGRTHRPERRAGEIEYLKQHRVRLVVSTMTSRHNLADYERAGLEWHHVAVPSCEEGAEALDEVVAFLRVETARAGAIAIHGNLHTDFVAAVGAAHIDECRGISPELGLIRAAEAGLDVTEDTAALLGVDYDEIWGP